MPNFLSNLKLLVWKTQRTEGIRETLTFRVRDPASSTRRSMVEHNLRMTEASIELPQEQDPLLPTMVWV